MKRVFIKTYGCQMNERDSELVAHDLVQKGYELVNNESGADIVLLNTCSVREQAEKKAIGKANNLLSKRKKNQQVTLGILGCMAQIVEKIFSRRSGSKLNCWNPKISPGF